ncbi:NAD(P)/FAD-dependent oxidoreductase [Streptomyces sp. CA-253872]|uniref:NAD(P)/FAD-dependent oxidoreductase n=1 Tax=Streptomyces sp. CA-253872 TaxID=3240067 RepID=UPI003D8A5726
MRVIVIGAGIAGAATGHRLARAGADTVLVDAGHEGRATSAGAGIVCPWTSRVSDEHLYRLLLAGAEHYPRLLAELAEDGEHEVGHRRVGSLRLLGPGGEGTPEADAVRATIAARAENSPLAGEVSLIDGAAAQALFPALDGTQSAVHVPGAARVDGRLLRDALCRAAARHGARLAQGPASLLVRDGRVRGAVVDGERLDADAVVVAAGAWAPAVLEPVGVHVPVAPQRGQIVHLALPGTDTSAWPVVLPNGAHYLLAFDGSRVVVGATRETGSGYDPRLTAAGLAEVLTSALAVAPGLAGATILETRVGLRPMSPDGRPQLGTVPRLPGLVVLDGLGPSGLTIGPYAGTVAARLALGEDPGLGLSPYDPER